MTRRLALVGGLVALVAVWPARATKRPQGCKVPGSGTVLAKSKDAVVYRRPAQDEFWVLTTCWRPTGNTLKLVEGSDDVYAGKLTLSDIRIAGPFVAYVTRYATHNNDVNKVAWRASLRSKYGASSLGQGVSRSGCCAYPLAGEGVLDSLQLDPRGSVAWRQQDENGWEVWTFDRRGSLMIDRGDEPVAHLNLSRGALTWSRTGRVFHSRLLP